jgi:hypothetical protein
MLSAGLFGEQCSSRACIVGSAANHQRLQQKKKYSNRPPCGVNTFPLKRSAEIVQLTSKFVWTGAWLTLLFKEDSNVPRIHNHDSNTHNAHTYLLRLTSKFVWTIFGRSCDLSKIILHSPLLQSARNKQSWFSRVVGICYYRCLHH